MRIVTIEAHNFRNFQQLKVEADCNYNILYGDNGSGKTSFLEIIHFLGLGRSFRTNIGKRIIKDQADRFLIVAVLKNQADQIIPIGIEKTLNGDTKIKLRGNTASITEVAELLPIQLLNNDSFDLLTEGPQYRRKFLDWGLFHVKHSFIEPWQKYQQALKQRNILLKQKAAKQQIQAWDNVIVNFAELISSMRQDYIEQWKPIFLELLADIFPLEQLSIRYQQGWNEQCRLAEVLEQAFGKDFELGYTFYGIHRADLVIKINKTPIADVLSRGQQKIFVWAMRVAQSILLKQSVNKECIYLIDDLSSELDPSRRLKMIEVLKQTQSQLFITGLVKEELIAILPSDNKKMFHVKHGMINYDGK